MAIRHRTTGGEFVSTTPARPRKPVQKPKRVVFAKYRPVPSVFLEISKMRSAEQNTSPEAGAAADTTSTTGASNAGTTENTTAAPESAANDRVGTEEGTAGVDEGHKFSGTSASAEKLSVRIIVGARVFLAFVASSVLLTLIYFGLFAGLRAIFALPYIGLPMAVALGILMLGTIANYGYAKVTKTDPETTMWSRGLEAIKRGWNWVTNGSSPVAFSFLWKKSAKPAAAPVETEEMVPAAA